MTDKRKQRARALSEKTGMSHQAAINAITKTPEANDREPEPAPQPEAVLTIPDVLKEFQVGHVSSILVGRMPAQGRSATYEVARQAAEDLSRNPKYFAKAQHISKTVTFAQLDALAALGATRTRDVQVARVLSPGVSGTTFSVQCARCHRWIWCGESEREGTCLCGQSYRVVFEAIDDWEPWHWDAQQRKRCTGCGTEWGLTLKGSGHNPWWPVNEAQICCNACGLLDGDARDASERFWLGATTG